MATQILRPANADFSSDAIVLRLSHLESERRFGWKFEVDLDDPDLQRFLYLRLDMGSEVLVMAQDYPVPNRVALQVAPTSNMRYIVLTIVKELALDVVGYDIEWVSPLVLLD